MLLDEDDVFLNALMERRHRRRLKHSRSTRQDTKFDAQLHEAPQLRDDDIPIIEREVWKLPAKIFNGLIVLPAIDGVENKARHYFILYMRERARREKSEQEAYLIEKSNHELTKELRLSIAREEGFAEKLASLKGHPGEIEDVVRKIDLLYIHLDSLVQTIVGIATFIAQKEYDHANRVVLLLDYIFPIRSLDSRLNDLYGALYYQKLGLNGGVVPVQLAHGAPFEEHVPYTPMDVHKLHAQLSGTQLPNEAQKGDLAQPVTTVGADCKSSLESLERNRSHGSLPNEVATKTSVNPSNPTSPKALQDKTVERAKSADTSLASNPISLPTHKNVTVEPPTKIDFPTRIGSPTKLGAPMVKPTEETKTPKKQPPEKTLTPKLSPQVPENLRHAVVLPNAPAGKLNLPVDTPLNVPLEKKIGGFAETQKQQETDLKPSIKVNTPVAVSPNVRTPILSKQEAPVKIGALQKTPPKKPPFLLKKADLLNHVARIEGKGSSPIAPPISMSPVLQEPAPQDPSAAKTPSFKTALPELPGSNPVSKPFTANAVPPVAKQQPPMAIPGRPMAKPVPPVEKIRPPLALSPSPAKAKVAPAQIAPAKVVPVKVGFEALPAKVGPAKTVPEGPPAKVGQAKTVPEGPPAKVGPAKTVPEGPPTKVGPAKTVPEGPPAKVGPAKTVPEGPPAKVVPAKTVPEGPPAKVGPAKAVLEGPPAKVGPAKTVPEGPPTKVGPAKTVPEGPPTKVGPAKTVPEGPPTKVGPAKTVPEGAPAKVGPAKVLQEVPLRKAVKTNIVPSKVSVVPSPKGVVAFTTKENRPSDPQDNVKTLPEIAFKPTTRPKGVQTKKALPKIKALPKKA